MRAIILFGEWKKAYVGIQFNPNKLGSVLEERLWFASYVFFSKPYWCFD